MPKKTERVYLDNVIPKKFNFAYFVLVLVVVYFMIDHNLWRNVIKMFLNVS